MDESPFNPYVSPGAARGERAFGFATLQLLLVLSALLTGLTGLIAGERPVNAQQVERSAIAVAAVADAVVAAPTAGELVPLAAPVVGWTAVRAAYAALADEVSPSVARVDERQLE